MAEGDGSGGGRSSGRAKKAGAGAGGLGLAAAAVQLAAALSRAANHDDPTEMVAPADIVAADPETGGFFVADPGAHQVFWLHGDDIDVAAGTGADGVTDVAGDAPPPGRKPGGDAGRVDLGEPVALIEHDGVLYVADRELGAVVEVYGEMRLATLPGPAMAPQALAAAPGSPLYAALSPTIDGNGPLDLVAWSAGTARAPAPVAAADELGASEIGGLGVASDGTLYEWVDDDGLYAIDPEGGAARIVDATGDERYEVADLAVGGDDDSEIAVAEPDAKRVTVFRPDGGVLRRVDLPFRPSAVAFDQDASVVVLRPDDPDRVFAYRIADDGTAEAIGPGATHARASDRLTSATTTTTP